MQFEFFFCMLRVARVQPVVTDTLARFFSFHPFQNVFLFFCRFKTKLGPFSKHPSIFSLEHHVGAEVAETGYFSRSTRKRFLFHVFHSSTFDDIYSSRGGETFFVSFCNHTVGTAQ